MTPLIGLAALVGVYHCSIARFDGKPAACPPPLVLSADGTYSFGNRRGGYDLKDGVLVLSGVGAASISPDGRLGFAWMTGKDELDVAYVKDAPAGSQASAISAEPSGVPVGLGVRLANGLFSGRVDALLLEPGDGGAALRAPAAADGMGIMRAQFPWVPVGQAYTIVAASGPNQRAVGILDLRVAGSPVVYELSAK